MPRAYATDLHWRAVWLYYVQNFPVNDIAALLCISTRSVYRYLERFDQTGEVRVSRYRHGPAKLLGVAEQIVLLRIITSHPGIYLSEMENELFAMFGMHISLSTICRTLKVYGMY